MHHTEEAWPQESSPKTPLFDPHMSTPSIIIKGKEFKHTGKNYKYYNYNILFYNISYKYIIIK